MAVPDPAPSTPGPAASPPGAAHGLLRSWGPWLAGGLLMALPFLSPSLAAVTLVGPVPWLLTVHRGVKHAFLKGWAGGFVLVFVALSWMHHVASFIAFASGIYFGLFFAVWAWLVSTVRRARLVPLWVIAPLAGVAYESLALHVTIFPVNWLYLGHSMWPLTLPAQVVELGSVQLLSVLAWTVAGAIAELVLALRASGRAALSAQATWTPAAVAMIAWAFALSWGTARLAALDLQPGPAVGLVQGNVEQSIRLDPEQRAEVVLHHGRLTESLAGRGLELIAWPESTCSATPEVQPDLDAYLGHLARVTGAHLLVGAIGINEPGEPPSNSAFLYSPEGRRVARTDKRVLVVFAETLPVIHRIPALRDPISDWLSEKMGFRPFLKRGERAVPLQAGNTTYGALICYGDTIPQPSEELHAAGAEALLTLSNEAWFPPGELDQHLALATFRAIENRLPMGRSTNTGDTCVIDPAGRIVERLPRDEEGVLVARLPVTELKPVPAWVRRAVTWSLSLAAFVLAALALSRRCVLTSDPKREASP